MNTPKFEQRCENIKRLCEMHNPGCTAAIGTFFTVCFPNVPFETNFSRGNANENFVKAVAHETADHACIIYLHHFLPVMYSALSTSYCVSSIEPLLRFSP